MSGEQFLFSDVHGRNRKSAASLEVPLLMPIKTLAYAEPTHTFLDFFHMSKKCRRACRKFGVAMEQCYMDEFLCLLTAADMKSIVKLHKHNVNLMKCLGCLIAHKLTGENVQRLSMEHL